MRTVKEMVLIKIINEFFNKKLNATQHNAENLLSQRIVLYAFKNI